jgi:hypothetical protein
MSKANQSDMRLFVLERVEDVSGTSGCGVVAEGVEFTTGRCVLHWLTQLDSVAIYDNVRVLEAIHGHGGKTRVRWLEAKP